jgi:hypothetical protein
MMIKKKLFMHFLVMSAMAKSQHMVEMNLGEVSVLKNKDIGANNHYFIGGYYFQFSYFFPHAIIMSISTLG